MNRRQRAQARRKKSGARNTAKVTVTLKKMRGRENYPKAKIKKWKSQYSDKHEAQLST